MSQRKSSIKQQIPSPASSLLSPEELSTMQTILGPECAIVKSTVADVYRSSKAESKIVNKTGVLLIVKDSARRAYFIKVYQRHSSTLLVEQELTSKFSYKASRPYFHQFSNGSDVSVGLDFANMAEAQTFAKQVVHQIEERKERRAAREASKRRKKEAEKSGLSGLHSALNGSQEKVKLKPVFARGTKPSRAVTKDDIGNPKNFQRVTHIGYDCKVGFDLDSADPKILKFFEKARVIEKDLEDENRREAILGFLENHPGGVEGAISDVERDTKAEQAKNCGEDLPSKDTKHQDDQSGPKKQNDRQTSCQEQASPTMVPPHRPASTPSTPSKPTPSSASSQTTPPPTPSTPTPPTTPTPSLSASSAPEKSEASPRKALLDAIAKGAPLRPVVPSQEKKEEDLGIWAPLAQAIKDREAACNGSDFEDGSDGWESSDGNETDKEDRGTVN